MRSLKIFGFVFFIAILAGCAGSNLGLSPNLVASLRITNIEVAFTPNANTSIDSIRQHMMGLPQDSIVRKEQAYVGGLVRHAMEEEQVSHVLSGSRPATLRITLSSFTVPNPLMQYVVGVNAPSADWETSLIDAKTGETLGHFNDSTSTGKSGLGQMVFDAAMAPSRGADGLAGVLAQNMAKGTRIVLNLIAGRAQ